MRNRTNDGISEISLKANFQQEFDEMKWKKREDGTEKKKKMKDGS